MPTREELESWDRRHVWHPFTQMAEYRPLLIERAEGCTLIDLDGRRLLDGASSMWCNVHGHRQPAIDAAIRRQLAAVAHTTSLGLSNPTTIALARRLVELAPAGLEHVFFGGDGASAVEAAIKLALQYWRQRPDPRPEKTLYLAFDDAYHGDTLGAVSVGGVARFHAMFEPLLFEVLRLPTPRTTDLPAGVAPHAACEHYLAQLAAALQQHADRLAAVVIEPLVQCAAGMVVHPPGYLRGVRELTRRHDVLLIADEVAVGLGRTGRLFACEHEGVTPDLLCLAKGLTGGYLAMSATLATSEIHAAFLGRYDEAKAFFHGHTYAGNPLAAAAALATLDLFESEQTLFNLAPKIARLAEWLARWAEHPHAAGARQCGLLAAIDLVRDRATGEPFPWEERRGQRLCDAALERGVWLRPLGSVVYAMPPLAITLDELDQIGAAVAAGLDLATGE